jgi:hypothetical protein
MSVQKKTKKKAKHLKAVVKSTIVLNHNDKLLPA